MKISVTPFLWFDGHAAEAANFYVSTFGRSKTTKILESNEVSTSFEIHGIEMIAFNGGPHFKFNPAISMFVSCKTQAQVDRLWERLSKGGKKGQCGWLTDRYGLSWQIVPEVLGELMADSDEEEAARVSAALMKMRKLDISQLKRAHRGR